MEYETEAEQEVMEYCQRFANATDEEIAAELRRLGSDEAYIRDTIEERRLARDNSRRAENAGDGQLHTNSSEIIRGAYESCPKCGSETDLGTRYEAGWELSCPNCGARRMLKMNGTWAWQQLARE